MKKVLYISNIEVPYRVRFFNELSEQSDLTVLYERNKSANRNQTWSKSEKKEFKYFYLKGIDYKNEYSISINIFKYIFGVYDEIIIGCYNSPTQMFAIFIMKLFKIDYCINADGELFINDNTFKTKIKKFFLLGAKKYYIAGENASLSLKPYIDSKKIFVYYFSSLSKKDLAINRAKCKVNKRNKTVLVIGQYFDYKGMDVALEVAKMDHNINYIFVGMGERTNLFISNLNADEVDNIKIVPFLSKTELEKQYLSCGALLLPTRQECWGLVVNEAASYGMPIVSTWGSGAAVEFLKDKYSIYLAEPNNAVDLYKRLKLLLQSDTKEYSDYLLQKSKNYSIDKSVKIHANS